jgi:hypothetical protein
MDANPVVIFPPPSLRTLLSLFHVCPEPRDGVGGSGNVVRWGGGGEGQRGAASIYQTASPFDFCNV